MPASGSGVPVDSVKFVAKNAGAAGDDAQVVFVIGTETGTGLDSTNPVDVQGSVVTVTLKQGGASYGDIRNAINGESTSPLRMQISSAEEAVMITEAATIDLEGGADAVGGAAAVPAVAAVGGHGNVEGLTFTAAETGTDGNSITIYLRIGGETGVGMASDEPIYVDEDEATGDIDIYITMKADGATLAQIRDAIDAHEAASALINVAVDGLPDAIAGQSTTALAGGMGAVDAIAATNSAALATVISTDPDTGASLSGSLTFTATDAGAAGNSIDITIRVVSTEAGSGVFSIVALDPALPNAISINLRANGATLQEIIDAVNDDATHPAAAIITAALTGDSEAVISSSVAGFNLAGGADAVPPVAASAEGAPTSVIHFTAATAGVAGNKIRIFLNVDESGLKSEKGPIDGDAVAVGPDTNDPSITVITVSLKGGGATLDQIEIAIQGDTDAAALVFSNANPDAGSMEITQDATITLFNGADAVPAQAFVAIDAAGGVEQNDGTAQNGGALEWTRSVVNEHVYVINLINVDDNPPVFLEGGTEALAVTYDENATPDGVIASFGATDADNTHARLTDGTPPDAITYTIGWHSTASEAVRNLAIGEGGIHAYFEISETGDLTLKDNAPALDFEVMGAAGLVIEVTATSTSSLALNGQGNAPDARRITKLLTINLNEINEAPTDITLDNLEIQAVATLPDGGLRVGRIAAIGDPDLNEAHTYAVSGADASFFTITGNVLFFTGGEFKAEGQTYAITITATDARGATFTDTFTITQAGLFITTTAASQVSAPAPVYSEGDTRAEDDTRSPLLNEGTEPDDLPADNLDTDGDQTDDDKGVFIGILSDHSGSTEFTSFSSDFHVLENAQGEFELYFIGASGIDSGDFENADNDDIDVTIISSQFFLDDAGAKLPISGTRHQQADGVSSGADNVNADTFTLTGGELTTAGGTLNAAAGKIYLPNGQILDFEAYSSSETPAGASHVVVTQDSNGEWSVKVIASAAAKATNADAIEGITFTAVADGAAGNAVQIVLNVDSAQAGSGVAATNGVVVDGSTITVTILEDGATFQQIKDAIDGDSTAAGLVQTAIDAGAESTNLEDGVTVDLSGGQGAFADIQHDDFYVLGTLTLGKAPEVAEVPPTPAVPKTLTITNPNDAGHSLVLTENAGQTFAALQLELSSSHSGAPAVTAVTNDGTIIVTFSSTITAEQIKDAFAATGNAFATRARQLTTLTEVLPQFEAATQTALLDAVSGVVTIADPDDASNNIVLTQASGATFTRFVLFIDATHTGDAAITGVSNGVITLTHSTTITAADIRTAFAATSTLVLSLIHI